MWAQGAAMGYAMAAQWLEEALGDTDNTAHHTEDDWHLCLRTKGHKGYHMDKHTGLNSKWNNDD